jgi:hypothetical protein
VDEEPAGPGRSAEPAAAVPRSASGRLRSAVVAEPRPTREGEPEKERGHRERSRSRSPPSRRPVRAPGAGLLSNALRGVVGAIGGGPAKRERTSVFARLGGGSGRGAGGEGDGEGEAEPPARVHRVLEHLERLGGARRAGGEAPGALLGSESDCTGRGGRGAGPLCGCAAGASGWPVTGGVRAGMAG